jgi:hypothetical protein
MNLSNFDGNTILGAYNAIANNPVKRFADRKTAERRFLSVAQASGYSDEATLEILRRHGPEAADGMDQSADVVEEATSPDAPADFIEQYIQPEGADEPQTEADATVMNGTIVDDSEIPEFLKGDASVKAAKAASVKAMADELRATTTSIDIADLHASDHPIAKANKASWDQVAKGGKAKAEKADKPAKPAKPVKPTGTPEAPVEAKKTKNETMLDMAKSPTGATEAEICAVLGWKGCIVTLRRAAEKAGLKLTSEKQKGGKARYFAK